MSEKVEQSVEGGSSVADDGGAAGESVVAPESGLIAQIIQEIIYSPLNVILVFIIAILIYKIFRGRYDDGSKVVQQEEKRLPKIKRDFTIQELKKYDGTQEDGRVLLAVNGIVYDVTLGKRFYGPGGVYSAFGGRDASRGLATFSVTTSDKEYDDLSDLSIMEMDSVREWEMQFKEKYDIVGKLLKPGEQPTNYEDEDDETTADKSTDEIGDISSNGNENSEVRKRINVTDE